MKNQTLFVFLGGVALGAGLAIAANSKQGKAMRKKAAKKIKKEKEKLLDAVDTIRSRAAEVVDDIRHKTAEAAEEVCAQAQEIVAEEKKARRGVQK